MNAWCPVCQNNIESTFHALVTCPFAEECWKYAGLPTVIGDFRLFIDWFAIVLQQCKQKDIHLIIMLCWMVWKNRNDLIWNHHSLQVREVVELATSIL